MSRGEQLMSGGDQSVCNCQTLEKELNKNYTRNDKYIDLTQRLG